MEDLWQRAQRLLERRSFADHTLEVINRLPLIELVNNLNGPRMLLTHFSTLANIQRIPHSDENLAVDALEETNKYGAYYL